MNTTKSRLPSTEELAAAIRKLHIGGYAPSVAIFKSAHCNAEHPDRWMQPDAICRHYKVSETVEGWAALCYQLTGLLTADRAFYLSHSYGTDKRNIAA